MTATADAPGKPLPAAPGFVDPRVLLQIESLELRARHVVDGFWSGLNRSPYHGFSVEFTEYREYTPGDDPRYLDWKLYARSDRYYVKRFEDETNLRCLLLLDASRSMEYGSTEVTKFDYARTLAATFGYFLTTQRDAVGLARFSREIDQYIPARYRAGHWRRLLVALEAPCTGTATELAPPLEQVAERLTKRGMLVLISDLLAPLAQVELSLGCLTARGQEVLVFQTLDPAEMTFDFDRPELFEDLESGRKLYVDPATLRAEYRRRLNEHLAAVQGLCDQLGITYRRLTTDQPLGDALGDFLRSRLRSRDRRTTAGGRRRA
ncbi:MAG TPA: DUF58 domain-containing protein [Planctomycetaceae bacterium]|nr:DUF58 domain-containing protein [Planctomycetaceae bacterium]